MSFPAELVQFVLPGLFLERFKMRKRLLFFAAAALVALTGYAYWFHGPHALQAYLAGLRAKGEKMTLGELIGSFSTNSGDCLEVLSDCVARFGPVSCEVTNARLVASVELTNAGALRFVQPGRAQVSFREPTPPWAGSVAGPQCSTWSGSSNRLAQVVMPLRELRNGVKHPDANGGPRSDVFRSVTPWLEVKEADAWLTFSALVALHDGRNAEALADVEALAGLANLHREEYSLVSEMTRVATAEFGLDVTWQTLQATGWNDAQLAELQHSWEAVDLLGGLERAFLGERAFGMEASSRLEAGEVPGLAKNSAGAKVYEFALLPNDVLFRTRNLQGRVEAVRALCANRPWQGVAKTMEKLDAEIEAKCQGPQRYLYLLSCQSVPSYRRPVLETVQTETKLRLAVCSIALKRYQLKHGRFPTRLEALVPAFVASVPFDPMSGAPLGYFLNRDGTFTLYSVGEDGKDDGGDASAVTSTTGSLSPAKVREWGGRDIVWPWPAGNVQQMAGTQR